MGHEQLIVKAAVSHEVADLCSQLSVGLPDLLGCVPATSSSDGGRNGPGGCVLAERNPGSCGSAPHGEGGQPHTGPGGGN